MPLHFFFGAVINRTDRSVKYVYKIIHDIFSPGHKKQKLGFQGWVSPFDFRKLKYRNLKEPDHDIFMKET